MRRSLIPGALLTALLATSAAAQAPGYQQIDIGSVRAEYTAEVLDRINDILLEWSVSWSTDRIEPLMENYWPDAVLIPPDRDPLRGATAIEEYFREVMPDHGQVEAFMLDFDASGGMAQVFGNYLIHVQRQGQSGRTLSGPVLTVYVQRGRHWRIRTQVFLPSEG